MTSQGSPYARFRRALATGNPNLVMPAAAELPRVSLEDALAICRVLAQARDERYPRASAKWLSRLIAERGTRLEGAVSVAALLLELGVLPDSEATWQRLEEALRA